MQQKEKKRLLMVVIIGEKNGGKWVTILKRHLDSFKNANVVSQAPEYI